MSETIFEPEVGNVDPAPQETAVPNRTAGLNRRILFWSLMVGLLVLDQAVKFWSRHAADFTPGRTFLTVWPGVFELRLTFNEGIAFGWFQGRGVLLAPVAIAIAVGAIRYNIKNPHETKWAHVSAALLASGALGNLYDRIVAKQVTDMFYFRLIDFPVFNVADACITVAAFMLIVSWIREAFQPAQPQPASLVPATETTATPGE